jgi:hypothetical protein
MSHERVPSEALSVICWNGADGARVACCPLSRERAEAVVQAYARIFPRHTYWTEPVPWLEPAPGPAERRAIHRAERLTDPAPG